MTFDSFKWVAEKLGIPTMFAIIFCIAIYQTGKWTASHVFDPVVEKHIEFLDTEQESMKQIAVASSKQAENMERQSRQMEQHTALLESISRNSEGIKRNSAEIRDDQRKFPAVAEKTP